VEDITPQAISATWYRNTRFTRTSSQPSSVKSIQGCLPIRVFGGEDNRNRDTAAVSILKEQALRKGGKALVKPPLVPAAWSR